LTARDTGTAEVWRRVVDRAIPLRGRLRPVPAVAVLAATTAITAGLAWISPWAPAVVLIVIGGLAVQAARRFVARHADAVEVARMEQAARAAEQTGDVDAANALYAEARRMIAEDRVPAGVGFRVANILGAAAIATPFPVDVLRELRELWLIAPEAELVYAQVRDELERRLQTRIHLLASSIRAGLRAGHDIAPLRAELRELSRTETLERADALRARVDVIPIRRARVRPALPDLAPVDGSAGRRRRPLTELRAAVTASADPEKMQPEVTALYRQVRDAAADGGEHGVRTLITAMRLVATWATVRGDAHLLGELHGDARELIDRRNVPAGTGAELAGVLRECVGADPFPVTLLDDYAALRALTSDVRASLFWSIVDAAIRRLEARMHELARTGTASHAALGEIAAAFEATAARSRDPEITMRARKLAGRP
jgi:hypothetical protein